MHIRYTVELETEEREVLRALCQGGCPRVRKVKRAQILLAADAGQSDAQIAAALSVGTATVYRTKRDFVERGLPNALEEAPRPGAARKLSDKEELLLVAVACSDPPTGRARWTLELLAGEMVRLTAHEHLGEETVRRRLHEKQLKPWQHKMWCIPKVDAEYVARMEDVLELYTQPADDKHPVVCFDETPVQLLGETRTPQPPAPGLPAHLDYEYKRNGTANLFVFVDVHRPWRHVKATEHRTSADFAHCMRELVDEHYPEADRIRVVLDNLNTHSAGALYQAFAPQEARRILRRLEFHYVPKHASWLNLVEIEISVLAAQCLDRRIPDGARLSREVAAWTQQRNASGARIRWLFDLDKARQKLGKSYPTPAGPPPEAAEAAVHYQRALELYHELGEPGGPRLGVLHLSLSRVRARLGEHAAAVLHCQRGGSLLLPASEHSSLKEMQAYAALREELLRAQETQPLPLALQGPVPAAAPSREGR